MMGNDSTTPSLRPCSREELLALAQVAFLKGRPFDFSQVRLRGRDEPHSRSGHYSYCFLAFPGVQASVE